MAEKSDKTPQQKMAEAIGTIVYGAMEDVTSIYTGSLKSINGKKAVVTMNGQDQNVAVVSPELLTGAITRVFVPNGNMSNAFIVGKGKSDDGPTLPTVQIATGTYKGKGKYGSSNKNTLAFSFTPKFVFVTNSSSESYGYASFVFNSPRAYSHYRDNDYFLTVTWFGNSLSWYHASEYYLQLNNSDSTYYYFAIGY